jgi:hypothetical protein
MAREDNRGFKRRKCFFAIIFRRAALIFWTFADCRRRPHLDLSGIISDDERTRAATKPRMKEKQGKGRGMLGKGMEKTFCQIIP